MNSSDNPYQSPSTDAAPENGSVVARVLMYVFLCLGCLFLAPLVMVFIILIGAAVSALLGF